MVVSVQYSRDALVSTLASLSQICPDVQLHLSIDRPIYYGLSDICFVARVGGSIVGTVFISNVCAALLQGHDDGRKCTHQHDRDVLQVSVRR